MITSLRLQNFKCFEKQTLLLKPLTLLSGVNGTGKSSVMQALLLLRQSYQQHVLPEKGLALNGDLVRIGTAEDALFEGAAEDVIGFDVLLENNVEGKWRFNCHEAADVLNLALQGPDSAIYTSNIFNTENFCYLQAERLGPRRFFETSDFLVHQNRQLGSSGEYTAHFLSAFGRGETISNPKVSHPAALSLSIKDQVEAWLGEISPGTHIELTQNAVTDTVSLQYSFVGEQINSNKYRATNVGFGITYILPILVALIAAAPGSLLLIENPEAHLHPKGQAQMGDLVARAASGGVQIIVETHSDHVLNGIRVAVHSGKLPPDEVQLHFFQRKKGDWQSRVTSPRMDRNGRIDQWPDGFFDEWDKSLEALLD